jgi:hypothetical protein
MRLLIILLFILPLSLVAQQKIVKFDTESIALGKVKKGEKRTGEYKFTNISQEDVQIDIVSTCECTEAKWTTYPLAPGESGKISFVFDSSKKDHEEPIDLDVYFTNTDPKTGNGISVFLNYTFEFD